MGTFRSVGYALRSNRLTNSEAIIARSPKASLNERSSGLRWLLEGYDCEVGHGSAASLAQIQPFQGSRACPPCFQSAYVPSGKMMSFLPASISLRAWS